MLNIVLVEPEIPQNCGNIARTCAATRSRLHLIRPLGFDISEKAVRRAGLDYWPMVDLRVYDGLEQFFTEHPAPDLWLATTKAPRSYDQAQFRDGCYLFFGKETPDPRQPGHARPCAEWHSERSYSQTDKRITQWCVKCSNSFPPSGPKGQYHCNILWDKMGENTLFLQIRAF